MNLALMLILVEFLGFVFSSSQGGNDSESPSSVSNDSITESAKHGPKRIPGSQTNESKRNKKIVQLLRQKGNGVYNYKDASILADEHLRKIREKNSVYLREYQDRQKATNPIHRDKPFRKPRQKGYQSVENSIKRRTETVLRHNPGFSKTEAQKLAVEGYYAKEDEKYQRRRERMGLRERKFKYTGKHTYEAKKKRKINRILKKKDNGIDTYEQANELAEKHIEQEKAHRKQLRHEHRDTKKTKTGEE